jgi:hypothetical protein
MSSVESSDDEIREKTYIKGNTLTRFFDGAVSGFVSGAVLQPL